MKKCPKCAQTYEDRQEVCPVDKSALIIVDPMIGRLLDNRYQIVSKIGEGGMGAIYKAVHSEMGRTCAIKLMTAISAGNEDAVARFKREAKMASRIDNPHAVIIYDFGVAEGGMLFLAMEFIDGKPLSRAMAEQRMLPIDRVVHITNQIAEGLAAAHALEIVHRDLKPDNIMITRKGSDHDYVKVLDFGIAKTVTDDGEGAENLTKTGFVLGTPVYMSPEQLLGEKLDPRSDIYSLAIIVYQMLGGQLPFTGDNPQSVMMKRITSNPVPLRSIAPTVTEAIEQVVMDGLAREPENRTPTVETFAKALGLAARGSTKAVGERPTQRMPEVESHTMEWSLLQTEAQKSAPTKEDGTLTFQSPSTVERSRNTYPLTQAGQPFTQPQTAERPPRRTAENTALPFDPQPAPPPADAPPAVAPTPTVREQNIAYTPEKFITNRDLHTPAQNRTDVVSQPARRKPVLLFAAIGAAIIAIAVIAFLLIPRGGSGFAINIKGAPPGSTVYINDAQRSTVGADGTIKLPDLTPGQAAVRITRDGYADFTTTLSGNKGEEKSVEALLLPMEVDYSGKMALVPAGEFEMGSDARKVTLPAYYIDKYEVTNAEYKKFCDATGHAIPKSSFIYGEYKSKAIPDDEYFLKHPNSPIIGITYEDAVAYANWANKRIPDEAEWEKAASWDPVTGKKRLWPWGNEAAGVKANIDNKETAKIEPGGQFAGDKSAYGVFDMGGNVREYVANQNLADKEILLRGGSLGSDFDSAKTTKRVIVRLEDMQKNAGSLIFGFRCAVYANDPKLMDILRSRGK
ncbi:MAG: bifunctional serine/threonine-protein kinase/formylglycine-generating enzyme family protein [Blastocatellia bacterium]